MNRKIKVAIETKGFDSWGGGIDFVRHIASCIEVADLGNHYDKHLMVSKNDSIFYIKKVLQPLRGILGQIKRREKLGWTRLNSFDGEYLKNTFDNFEKITIDQVGSTQSKHLKHISKNNFNIVLPCIAPPSSDYNLNWIGYIYDFQHKYLPEFFTKYDIDSRDKAFYEMLNRADHVIVNAKSVKEDAIKFIGNFRANIHVLPFSPSPRKEWLEEDRDLTGQYHIDKPYFIISNQFWIHKDHKTAFVAFAEFLKQSKKDYLLVCTGDTFDSRFPNYFNELILLLKELNIEQYVKILGHIPKLDQIALLKNAKAVIQTTLFEGGPGGGASYDAIALGVPLIVSDIPVNLEIEEDERVVYFQAKNINNLVEQMLLLSNKSFAKLSNDELLAKGSDRKIKCGQVLLELIDTVVKK